MGIRVVQAEDPKVERKRLKKLQKLSEKQAKATTDFASSVLAKMHASIERSRDGVTV